jgi:hypothetical protein
VIEHQASNDQDRARNEIKVEIGGSGKVMIGAFDVTWLMSFTALS